MSAVGTPMLRKEDPTLLTGEGKYVDDIQAVGQLWMGMVRSPYAHAKVLGIETADAAAAPGVHVVYTGADLEAMGLWIGPLPCAWPVTPDMVNPPHFPVATAEVNHVGDIVAVVLADDRYRAADAAELVVVDYDPLPAVASIDAALADEAMAHSDLGTNKAYLTRPCTSPSSQHPLAIA
ncbi:MAG: xanthine dehydrogenase family protein molybdopterin-binding subunit, partial [Actinobacteria bacterium]|nr:xanthine dehydrogenase family protein molybdopterin-binding subunit [Actinomycetota bacterium]